MGSTYKPNCLYVYVITVLLAFPLLFLIPTPCLAGSPDEDRVYALINKYEQLLKLGRYQEAIIYAEELVTAGEKVYGTDHPNVAVFLNNFAMLYYALGDYPRAEPLYKRSLAIREKAFGKEHPNVATALVNLALLYKSQGDFIRAESLYKRSLKIMEKALGPEHPNVAANLNNLAGLYYSLGDYSKAEPLYQRALTISEKALGPEHPNVARSLNNLAGLYVDLGDYAKAEQLYKRSLKIKEKVLDPEHPSVASTLNDLAELYRTLGDYPKAEPLYKKSLAIMEKTVGSGHPKVAQVLNNMAGLYFSIGDLVEAKRLMQRSLAIKEKNFGLEHPNVAKSLTNLAIFNVTLGDYTEALRLYQRSITIIENAFGPEHPDLAQSLNHFAGFLASTGDFENSHKLFKRAQAIDGKLIDQVMGFTSEEQKIKFLSTKKHSLNLFLSLIDQHLSHKISAKKDALNVWLKRKGVILEAQRRFQEALVYSDDLQAVKTFQNLSRVRAQLSKLAFVGPGKEGLDAYKKKMADLKAQKEKLEARLSKLSQAFALKQKIAKADCEKVSGALPPKTILIEFARVEVFNFKTKWLSAHYLAFILHAGKGNKIGLIDLGDAYLIDKVISGFKKEIAIIRKLKNERIIKSSKEIYDLVFKPLKRELGDVKEIFISPDGNLNLIPFEVLQGPDGKFLIEDYTFNYLAAGRDLLGFGQIKEQGKKALLMGDPDFDMREEEKNSTLRRLALSEVEHKEIVKRSLDMRGLHFTRLPSTREEVKAIHALLGKEKAELYTGKEALEDVLKQSGTPRILHLATHGFFLSDLEFRDLVEEEMGRGIKLTSMIPKTKGKRLKIENPLLRSGFALAGANNAIKSGDTEKSGGIVTAEKILGLKLRGTDMVVLSACETGVGEVRTGEGVFGLRRAFTQAGTRSLVMSMWAVPDRETKELMIEFYKNIKSGKMNRCQALRQASLEQMKIVKERYGHTNPFFWGAFVFLGEP